MTSSTMGDYTGERLVGLDYDAMFPTEEGSVSLVGGTCLCPVPSWASPCLFHPGVFSVASLWFSPTSCLSRATLLFSKTFLVRSLRGWEGQAESYSYMPLAAPCLENQSREDPSGQPERLKYGAGAWRWPEASWASSSLPARLRLTKFHRTNLIPFEPQFPSPP